MSGLALTHIIPIQELTPGQVGKIRNDAIEGTVAMASKELNLPRERLVVRDVRPVADLAMYSILTTASTVEWWYYSLTADAVGWTAVSPTTGTMGDNKFVCLFGIRDLSTHVGHSSMAATATTASRNDGWPVISMVKLNVGGSDKVTWDACGLRGYSDHVGFTPSAVIIPQNTSFVIYYYQEEKNATALTTFFQLIGVTVEPRGLTISP